VDQVLGVIFLAVYIVGVVGLAAAMTWAVVRIFPTERGGDKPEEGKKPSSTNDEVPGGRLFRRAKRGAS
jgi:hypothetical protein